MNILSLFDGISCGQLALQRAGIEVQHYHASEINKYASIITQKNFPNTIQLGDINQWQSWGLNNIDLIIGGSPCQGFSYAGNKLNFNDPRSTLFFTFADIISYYNPTYFLLENVSMARRHRDIISDTLGVQPVEINSLLVSAQNRKRFYWTNFPITMPEDKHIYLSDILEAMPSNKVYEGIVDPSYDDRPIDIDKQTLIGRGKGITFDTRAKVYSAYGKSQTVLASQQPKISFDRKVYRSLSVIECERLQTLPDNYTHGISNSQRYHAIGNGWTVDVLAHIFSAIKG